MDYEIMTYFFNYSVSMKIPLSPDFNNKQDVDSSSSSMRITLGNLIYPHENS